MPLLYEEDQVKLYHGHVLAELRQLPDASVHSVCTSPPYFGLRSYGTEPQIWDNPGGCEHVWGGESTVNLRGQAKGQTSSINDTADYIAEANTTTRTTGAFCQHCHAWVGSLGLEPTPDCGRAGVKSNEMELRDDLTPEEREFVIGELIRRGIIR